MADFLKNGAGSLQNKRRPNQRAKKLCFDNLFEPDSSVDLIVQRIRRQVISWLEAYGLPDPVIRVLLILRGIDGPSGRELGTLVRMSPPQLSLNLKNLIGDGIVISQVDPVNATIRRFFLSELGTTAADRLIKAREIAISAALEGLAGDQKTRVEQALREYMSW